MDILKFRMVALKFAEGDALRKKLERQLQLKLVEHYVASLTGTNVEMSKTRDEVHTIMDVIMDSMVTDGHLLREIVPDREQLRRMLRELGVV